MHRLLIVLTSFAFLLPSLRAQKVSYDEFAQAITQALRLDDTKGLDRAVKENSIHTVGHFRALVVGAVNDSSAAQRTEAERTALKASWLRVFDGRTLELVERWVHSLDGSSMRSIDRSKQALGQAYTEFFRLRDDKVRERKLWDGLAETLRTIGSNLEAKGDQVNAADAYGLLSQVYDSIVDKGLDDRRQVLVALGQFESLRRSCDWVKDDHFLRNHNFLEAEKERLKLDEAAAEKRAGEGYGGEVRGADAYLVPDADNLEKIVDLEFEMVTKAKDDIAANAGPVPPKWLAVSVLNSGPEKMLWFKARDLFIVRPGNNKFGITLDGSEPDLRKNPFLEIEANSKLKKPSMFWLDEDKTRPYAMWFFVGGASEPFQGLSHNLEPYEQGGVKKATVYYKSAASWVANVDGTKVVLYDDNGSGGLFEVDPFEFGLKDRNLGAGPDDEVSVPALDAMQIDRGGVGPFSSWAKIGDQWYHLRGQDGGTKLGLRATNPEYFKTGMLELDWSGAKNIRPKVLVVQGSGDFQGARFEIADGKPVEVPASEYTVVYGRIELKQGGKLVTAEIFPGEAPAVTVVGGETAKLALGAPFHIDFAKELNGGKLSIDSTRFRVRGVAGELYARLNGCAVTPSVMVSRSEDGKGAREMGQFVAIPDADVLNKLSTKFQNTLNNNVGYYPIPKGEDDTTVLEIAVPDGSFVGLLDKKNKFFGKIDARFQ